MKITALIPARGGSKRVPGKHLRDCGGRPLIEWTIIAALESPVVAEVIVSTDSEEIAQAARNAGAAVPFKRPENLAGDRAEMGGVVRHATEWLVAHGRGPDVLMLLQPTSPLRRSMHIDQAVELYGKVGPNSLVTVCKVPSTTGPAKLMSWSGVEVQFLEVETGDPDALCLRNGPSILMIPTPLALAGQLYGEHVFGMEMDRESSIDVDDEIDLAIADCLLRRKWSGV
jgi:CMP-N,N'-diacetyllegionaminic acid synthase